MGIVTAEPTNMNHPAHVVPALLVSIPSKQIIFLSAALPWEASVAYDFADACTPNTARCSAVSKARSRRRRRCAARQLRTMRL